MSSPLTPADCDLRGLTFMPLDVLRLRDSDLALLSSGDEFKAAVLLWCASWHQTPAGSLPTDDRVLLRLSGVDPKAWKKAKEGALRGWVQCDDGRLYHPVVAEKALEAWQDRQKYRAKRDADRERLKDWREKKQLKGDDETPGETHRETRFETPKTEEGTGSGVTVEGTGSSSDPDGSALSASLDDDLDPLADLRAMPVAKGCWRLAVKVLVDQGRLSDPKARAFIGKLKAGGLTDDELWQIAEAAFNEQTEDPQPYLVKAAEGVIERRGAGSGFGPSLRDPSPNRQRLWMTDYKREPREWRRHERGPCPGEPGCQVSAEIQREFGFEPAPPQPVARTG